MRVFLYILLQLLSICFPISSLGILILSLIFVFKTLKFKHKSLKSQYKPYKNNHIYNVIFIILLAFQAVSIFGIPIIASTNNFNPFDFSKSAYEIVVEEEDERSNGWKRVVIDVINDYKKYNKEAVVSIDNYIEKQVSENTKSITNIKEEDIVAFSSYDKNGVITLKISLENTNKKVEVKVPYEYLFFNYKYIYFSNAKWVSFKNNIEKLNYFGKLKYNK